MRQMPSSGTPVIGPYGLPTQDAVQSGSSSPPPTLTTSTTSSTDGTSTSEQSFTDPTTAMPPPGVALFEARRARWLTRPEGRGRQQREPSPSTSRTKLEALLASDDAISSEEVWDAGIGSVWKGLVGGGRLRRRLPLNIVLKILQAGWVRDGTWPTNGAGSPLRVTRAPPLPTGFSPSDSPRRNGDNQEADVE